MSAFCLSFRFLSGGGPALYRHGYFSCPQVCRLISMQLLAPLGDSEPAGSSSVYFELRAHLEDLRREINPEDFDAKDPTRPTEPKRADWARIEEMTRTALAKTSKDLRLAGYLVEALVQRYGFPGLRDGLKLLSELLEQCWDRLYPSIEDGDLDVRAGVFNSLDDLNTRGRMPFVQVVRTVPILGAGAGKHGFDDWKTAQEPGQEALADSVAKAIQATLPEARLPDLGWARSRNAWPRVRAAWQRYSKRRSVRKRRIYRICGRRWPIVNASFVSSREKLRKSVRRRTQKVIQR